MKTFTLPVILMILNSCSPPTPTVVIGPSGKPVDVTGRNPREIVQDPNNGQYFIVPVPQEQRDLERRFHPYGEANGEQQSFTENNGAGASKQFRVSDPGLLAIRGIGANWGRWRTLQGMTGMEFRFSLENDQKPLGWYNDTWQTGTNSRTYGYRWAVEIKNNNAETAEVWFKLRVSTSEQNKNETTAWTYLGKVKPYQTLYSQFADVRMGGQ